MKTKDLKLLLNKTLVSKAKEKVIKEFRLEKCKNTELVQIVLFLALSNKWKKKTVLYACSCALDNVEQNSQENFEKKTIEIYDVPLSSLKEKWNYCAKNASDIVNIALALYILTPLNTYTSNIKPLYSIVGSKNVKMQCADNYAVSRMKLNYSDTVLIDACSATGALFFGLNTYPLKGVILNDLNPERVNFLNVLLKKPFQLISVIFREGIDQSAHSDVRQINLAKYREAIEEFKETTKKVDCDVTIAAYTFLLQCLDKKGIENQQRILNRLARFLPAHLKMIHSNVKITMVDAANYLKPCYEININHQKVTVKDNRMVLFDPPYIGSEKTCDIKDFNYPEFHKRVGALLQKAKYPFLYHCRSTAPKSDNTYPKDEWERVLKNELSKYFFRKNFYLEKIYLKQDTELIISRTEYNPNTQFLWYSAEQDIK